MPISTRTTTKATHRTTLTYTAPFGHRADKGRTFVNEALDIIQKHGDPARMIIEFGVGGGVSSIAIEQTQTVPQRDIQD
jgi:hypothetical protein